MTPKPNETLEGQPAAPDNIENILHPELLPENEALMKNFLRAEEEQEKIQDIKKSILEDAETPFEHVSLGQDGKLIGTEFVPAAPAKKEGIKLPNWMKKTAQVLGIASVGMLASNQAKAGYSEGDGGKAKNKTETVATAENSAEVSDDVKSAWDQYVEWLDQKGLKGSPKLDKGTKGIEMLQQFITEHSNTPLSLDKVLDIQNYFKEYREWLIKEVAAKRIILEGNITIDELMQRLSDKDGYPGSWTTSHEFPKDKTVSYAAAAKAHGDKYMKIGDISNRK